MSGGFSQHRGSALFWRRGGCGVVKGCSLFDWICRALTGCEILFLHVAGGIFDLVENVSRLRGRLNLGESLLQRLFSFLHRDARFLALGVRLLHPYRFLFVS